MSHTCQTPIADETLLSENRPIRRQIPSLRNRDVFAAVAAGKTHEEVAKQFGLTQPRVTHSFARKNSYDSKVLSTSFEAAASIKQQLNSPAPAVPLVRESKPVPKFLDKKVRKRLLALRRQAARAEALGAVG